MEIKRDASWDVTDSTKIQDYIRCPRRYFFSHVLGWRPEEPSIHLVFGSALHKALEVIYEELKKTGDYNEETLLQAYEAFLVEYRETFSEASDDSNAPKEPSQVLPALAAYTKKYKKQDKFQILYTEIAGSVPIGDGMELYFRLDGICEDERGKFVLEHKTTSRYFGKQWAMAWNLSIQIGTYTHVLYCMYGPENVWGALVNGLCFAKTKAVEFMRVPVQRTNASMQMWMDTVLAAMGDMKRDYEVLLTKDGPGNVTMKSFPQRPTACGDFGGCPFHAYCIAWPNPLGHVDKPPIGMKVEFWDPRDKEKDTKVVKHL